jgi:hypothetical protein
LDLRHFQPVDVAQFVFGSFEDFEELPLSHVDVLADVSSLHGNLRGGEVEQVLDQVV